MTATGSGLPLPSVEEQLRSDRLRGVVRTAIADAGGLITFSQFMELALYSVRDGYYASDSQKFGEHGDFVTAPELGSLFARSLSRQIAQVRSDLGGGDIMEVGGGSGRLALELLRNLCAQDSAPDRYHILETSASLAHRQRELLSTHAPELMPRVNWLGELPQEFNGVIVANEVVDAIPVDRFVIENGRPRGIGVAWDSGDFVDASYLVNGANWDTIRSFDLPEGYISEAGFQREAWMRSIADCLQTGVILIIDYGFPRHEYFHPQRNGGTLMCHYRHRSHFDPYIYIGLQDITAHVDFTGLAQSAIASELTLLGFTTQASFLLSLGILDDIEPAMLIDSVERLAATQELKKLTLPSEMGELFKVVAVGRGLQHPLKGFAHMDHRGRL